MRKIKLMTDYECYPLWEEFCDGVDNIAPDTLPISASLAARIDSWSELYDKTLNQEDPVSSGFYTEQEMNDFNTEGKKLYIELKNELGEGFNVVYVITGFVAE